MATGSLAVFFLALSAKIEPALTPEQKLVVAVTIVAMAATILAGLWSAFTDAQWSYCWAKFIEAEARSPRDGPAWKQRRDRWHRHKRRSEQASLLCFVAGVVSAAVYLWLRGAVG